MPRGPDPGTRTVALDPHTQRFLQGAAAAQRVREAHDPVTASQSLRVRRELFCFYVGVLAAGEYGCTDADEFSAFLLGASTRAPSDDESAPADVDLDLDWQTDDEQVWQAAEVPVPGTSLDIDAEYLTATVATEAKGTFSWRVDHHPSRFDMPHEGVRRGTAATLLDAQHAAATALRVLLVTTSPGLLQLGDQ